MSYAPTIVVFGLTLTATVILFLVAALVERPMLRNYGTEWALIWLFCFIWTLETGLVVSWEREMPITLTLASAKFVLLPILIWRVRERVLRHITIGQEH